MRDDFPIRMRFGAWDACLMRPYRMGGMFHSYWLVMSRLMGDKVEVLLPDGTMKQVEDFKEVTEEEVLCTLPEESLQSLMDGLWDKGIRPQERRYEEETKLLREQLELQARHLEDMRCLVFSLSNKPERR